MVPLAKEVVKSLPVFKVWADNGQHPPVALDKPVCVIGRREVGVNLPLQSPQVSKLHAFVVRSQQQVYVRDLASRNGVQRNGAPVQEVGLADEDVLRIGSYTLRCASGFGHGEENGAPHASAGANASSLPRAELVGPDGAGYPFPAGQHTVLIGERDGCDVQLNGDDIAPVHAILFEMNGKRYVRDLGAPAGTSLNDRPIHQSELNPGDAIRVGSVTLRYALTDVTSANEADDVEKDVAASLDALRVEESAAGIEMADSALSDRSETPKVATGHSAGDSTDDSMIEPEITMEDSRVPAAGERGASPISEYDMDVIDVDSHGESTFAGEVIAEGQSNAATQEDSKRADAGSDDAKSDGPKRQRPQRPPMTPASLQRGLDDSAVPIAGSFHDHLIDDEPANDVARTREQERVSSTRDDGATEARSKTESMAAPSPGSDAPDASVPSANAGKGTAAKPEATPSAAHGTPPASVAVGAAEEAISQLVDEVTDRVEHVSEQVEEIAAKVERVSQRMTEVKKEVVEVAQTAGTLQEAWSGFCGNEHVTPLPENVAMPEKKSGDANDGDTTDNATGGKSR